MTNKFSKYAGFVGLLTNKDESAKVRVHLENQLFKDLEFFILLRPSGTSSKGGQVARALTLFSDLSL